MIIIWYPGWTKHAQDVGPFFLPRVTTCRCSAHTSSLVSTGPLHLRTSSQGIESPLWPCAAGFLSDVLYYTFLLSLSRDVFPIAFFIPNKPITMIPSIMTMKIKTQGINIRYIRHHGKSFMYKVMDRVPTAFWSKKLLSFAQLSDSCSLDCLYCTVLGSLGKSFQ
jgi:hypothetical protein